MGTSRNPIDVQDRRPTRLNRSTMHVEDHNLADYAAIEKNGLGRINNPQDGEDKDLNNQLSPENGIKVEGSMEPQAYQNGSFQAQKAGHGQERFLESAIPYPHGTRTPPTENPLPPLGLNHPKRTYFGVSGIICLIAVPLVAWLVCSQAAVGLLCQYGSISRTRLCINARYSMMHTSQDPEFARVQARLEPLMEMVGGSTVMSKDMKISEIAIRDLGAQISLSTIPSKELLGGSVDKFASAAKTAGRDLSKLHATVGGAIDSILAIDDYVRRKLDGWGKETPTLADYLYEKIWLQEDIREKQENELFETVMSVLKSNLDMMLVKVKSTSSSLTELDQHLAVIRDIVLRDDEDARREKNRLDNGVWTWLGGNKVKTDDLVEQRRLLSDASTRRLSAAETIGKMIVELENLEDDLDNLRDRFRNGDNVKRDLLWSMIMRDVERIKRKRDQAQSTEEETRRSIMEDENITTFSQE